MKKIPKREIRLILFKRKSKEFQHLLSSISSHSRKAIGYMLLRKKITDPKRDQEQSRTISNSRKLIGSKDHRIVQVGRHL